MNATKMHSNTVKASHAPRMKKIALIRKFCFIEFVPIMPNVCLTGWLQPVLNKERLRIASPVFKLLLCRCDETGYASRLGNNEISLMN